MTLEDLRVIATEAYRQIKVLKEPSAELMQITSVIKRAIETDRMGTEAAFNTWMCEKFGTLMTCALAKERSSDE